LNSTIAARWRAWFAQQTPILAIWSLVIMWTKSALAKPAGIPVEQPVKFELMVNQSRGEGSAA